MSMTWQPIPTNPKSNLNVLLAVETGSSRVVTIGYYSEDTNSWYDCTKSMAPASFKPFAYSMIEIPNPDDFHGREK